jgi:propanediol dehydratase small subunit
MTTSASTGKFTTADYPLAERRPDVVRGRGGKGLDEITLAAVTDGSIGLEDLSITTEALRQQADIARSAGRSTLAENFERAAELVDIPQDTIMRVYELLRPGRAKSKEELIGVATELQKTHGAELIARFVIEAAEVYERRGLFKNRF